MKTKYLLLVAAVAACFFQACSKPDITPEEKTDPDPIVNPDPPQPPVVSATPMQLTARWDITSSLASSGASSWTGSNRFYALTEDGKGKAYISTEAGGSTEPARSVTDSRVSVSNLSEGDCICVTYPSLTVAEGSTVSFMTTLMATANTAPKYWIFEYFEDGQWKSVEEDLVAAKEDPSLKYSFYVKYFSAYEYTTFTQSFTLEKGLAGEDLKMRMRAVGKFNGGGGSLSPSTAAISFVNSRWRALEVNVFQGIPVVDKKKMLVLGNSFSYYYETDFLLKRIARAEGHELRMRTHLKGGQDFGEHMTRERTLAAIDEGGYDLCLLQDMSTRHADYYMDTKTNAAVMSDTKTILARIKKGASSVVPVLEQTWAYSGSTNYAGLENYENFDTALQGGCLLVADENDCWISPIGEAFTAARKAGIGSMFHTDSKHPGPNGAYLKACVNYLTLYGTAFDANVPDCGIDAATAKKLRDIAEETVLGKIQQYRNPDASSVVPGAGISLGGGSSDVEIVSGENGIRTAAQLISFAALVNQGGDISSYKNAAGEVVLLDDIEVQNGDWTPIGSATGVNYNSIVTPAIAFSGVFDGQGHTITGLDFVISSNDVNVMGFFGATKDAVIRNVNFEDVTLKFNSSGISSGNITIGTVVAYALNTKIENVRAYAEFSGSATSTAARHVAIGGIVGTMAATEADASVVKDCTFDGKILNDVGSKYSNTNTAMAAGIVCAVENVSTCKTVLISGCTNNAEINAKLHRVAGIISSGFHSRIENCTNNGNITVNWSANAAETTITGTRVGGIMAYCSATVATDALIKDCINNGTIVSSQDGSAVGGVVGLMRCFPLDGARNTARVAGPDGGRGLLVGQITSATTESSFANCAVRGSIGKAADGSDAVTATAENYLPLSVSFASGVSASTWNADNVKFLAE